MNTLHRLLLGAALLLAPHLAAQDPDHFKPLGFLVGHCWIGTFPDGKQTDEHCFEWVFDGKFIRDRHVVRGGAPYQGESLYRWDAKRNQIAFSYWNSAGDLMNGTVEPTPEGIVFPQRIETAGGTTEMKTIWTRPTPNSYHVWVAQKTGTKWEVLWTMDLTRKD